MMRSSNLKWPVFQIVRINPVAISARVVSSGKNLGILRGLRVEDVTSPRYSNIFSDEKALLSGDGSTLSSINGSAAVPVDLPVSV